MEDYIDEIEFFDVQSSNLFQIGYDDENQQLYIRFLPKKNWPSTLYRYWNVPQQTFQELLAAESKGNYFHYNIREVYMYDRLE